MKLEASPSALAFASTCASHQGVDVEEAGMKT